MLNRFVPAVAATIVICFGTAGTAFADGPDAVSPAEAEAALEVAEELFDGGAAATAEPTLALRDLHMAMASLDPSDRRKARRMLGRPTDNAGNPSDDTFDALSGPEAAESPLCNTNFCIHWTDTGADSPDPTDLSPPFGVPDYIETVEAESETIWTTEVDTLGWRKPKPDGSIGTDNDKTDIYIAELCPPAGNCFFGYANTDPGQGLKRRQTAYLVLDDDYLEFGGPSGCVPLICLQVTFAHEFNHVVQFNYDRLQDDWMFEGVATWMEEQVYPDGDDYLNYIGDFASSPGVPLTDFDYSFKTLRAYGTAVWSHWLSSRFSTDIPRLAWQNSTKVDPKDFAAGAFDRAIKQAPGKANFAKEFLKFAAATAEWRSSAKFPDSESYIDVKRNGKLKPGKKLTKRLDHTAYKVFKVDVNNGSKLKATVKIESGTRGGIALVGRIGGATDGITTTQVDYARKGGKAKVKIDNPGDFNRLSVVVVNADIRVKGYDGSIRDWNYTRDRREFKNIVVRKVS